MSSFTHFLFDQQPSFPHATLTEEEEEEAGGSRCATRTGIPHAAHTVPAIHTFPSPIIACPVIPAAHPPPPTVSTSGWVTCHLSIIGMTCASCVNTIQNHLKNTFPPASSWLIRSDINLLTENGKVIIDTSRLGGNTIDQALKRIMEELENVGFEASVNHRTPPVTPRNGTTDTEESITPINPSNSSSLQRSSADELLKRSQATAQKYKRLLLFCLVFAIPIFIITMILSWIPAAEHGLMTPVHNSLSVGALILLCLSIPIQFGVGSVFYTSAWRSLRHRSANMSLLVAIGTSASFTYAIIAFIQAAITPMHMADTGGDMSHGHGSGGDMPDMPGMDGMSGMNMNTDTDSTPTASMGGEHFFETATTLITFVILGRYLEAMAKGKTSEALTKLTSMQVSVATKLSFDSAGDVQSEEDVPVDSLQPGDIVKVKRGCSIPADGIVTRGCSAVDESFLTGESLPVQKGVGEEVIGSSINQEEVLFVQVTRASNDGTLAHILRLMEDAQTNKAPIQKFADNISGIFVPTIIAISFITWMIWFILVRTNSIPIEWVNADGKGSGFMFSFLFGLSVIVIACPCALGLATPTAVMVGTGVGARMGVLIKGGAALETAHKVSAFVFDKTGSLTVGRPELTEVTLFTTNHPYERVLFLVASAELNSEHVLARAIVAAASANSSVPSPLTQPESFESVSGRGLKCIVQGIPVTVGNRAWMEAQGVNVPTAAEECLSQFERQGRIALCLALSHQFAAVLALADVRKPEAESCVRALGDMGIAVWMCTGDNRRTASTVALEVGIPPEHIVSEAMPQDKFELIKKLQSEGHVVAMLGDGTNDAPSLAAADLGFSVGAGTDVAMEAAEIILVKSDLRDVLVALDLSRATMRRIRYNFMWALGYNLIGLPIAAGVFYPAFHLRLPPEVAALAMALSSVSVVISSLWLKRYKKPVIKHRSIKRTSSHSTLPPSDEMEVEMEQMGGNFAVHAPIVFLHSHAHSTSHNGSESTASLSSASLPRSLAESESLLPSENDSSAPLEEQHDPYCPCGCECGMRYRARAATAAVTLHLNHNRSSSRSISNDRSRNNSIPLGEDESAESTSKVKSCCAPTNSHLQVHVTASVTATTPHKCACSCISCTCSQSSKKQ
jgi:Cu+-exporting ATPase